MICFGRFLFGICAGVFLVAAPKMIDETIPASHLAVFGTVTNTFLSLGITVAIMLGVVLPDDGDILGRKLDNNWRFVYGFPYIN